MSQLRFRPPVVLGVLLLALGIGWVGKWRGGSAEGDGGHRLAAGPVRHPGADTKSRRGRTELAQNDDPKLRPDQIEAYLTANRRNAESLLATYLGNNHLAEALERFPNDPMVPHLAAETESSTRRRSSRFP